MGGAAHFGSYGCPEIPAQTLEEAHFAPEFTAPRAAPRTWGDAASGTAVGEGGDAVGGQVCSVSPAGGRPEIPAQTVEKAHFTPGFAAIGPALVERGGSSSFEESARRAYVPNPDNAAASEAP